MTGHHQETNSAHATEEALWRKSVVFRTLLVTLMTRACLYTSHTQYDTYWNCSLVFCIEQMELLQSAFVILYTDYVLEPRQSALSVVHNQGHVQGQVKVWIKLPLVQPITLHTHPWCKWFVTLWWQAKNIKSPFFRFSHFVDTPLALVQQYQHPNKPIINVLQTTNK